MKVCEQRYKPYTMDLRWLILCLAAPCHSKGLTSCKNCSFSVDCELEYCNCYFDCYGQGNCCPDVAELEDCFRECIFTCALTCKSHDTVTLSSAVECEEGEVRLVDGETNSNGRLEVCGNGMWGTVYNFLGYWGPDNARVVCHQLGFFEQGTIITTIFNESTTPLHIRCICCTCEYVWR